MSNEMGTVQDSGFYTFRPPAGMQEFVLEISSYNMDENLRVGRETTMEYFGRMHTLFCGVWNSIITLQVPEDAFKVVKGETVFAEDNYKNYVLVTIKYCPNIDNVAVKERGSFIVRKRDCYIVGYVTQTDKDKPATKLAHIVSGPNEWFLNYSELIKKNHFLFHRDTVTGALKDLAGAKAPGKKNENFLMHSKYTLFWIFLISEAARFERCRAIICVLLQQYAHGFAQTDEDEIFLPPYGIASEKLLQESANWKDAEIYLTNWDAIKGRHRITDATRRCLTSEEVDTTLAALAAPLAGA